MKIINKKKDYVVKNSNYKSSSELLQTLQKVLNDNNGGTISYVFLTERSKFTKEFPDGKKYFTKFIKHSPINREILFKLDKERLIKRTLSEIIQIFEDTKNDIKANYYIIN